MYKLELYEKARPIKIWPTVILHAISKLKVRGRIIILKNSTTHINKFNHQGEPLGHMKLLNRRGLNTLRKRGRQTKIRDGIKR